MPIWTPGQPPVQQARPQEQKVVEPPPVPNEEELKAAQEAATYLKTHLTSHAARVALLSQQNLQGLVAEWMNVLMPAFAPQIIQLDRQQLLFTFQEMLRDEKMRMDLQGIIIGLDPTTMNTCLQSLLHLCQTLPPPFFQFQRKEEAPSGDSDNQIRSVS